MNIDSLSILMGKHFVPGECSFQVDSPFGLNRTELQDTNVQIGNLWRYLTIRNTARSPTRSLSREKKVRRRI